MSDEFRAFIKASKALDAACAAQPDQESCPDTERSEKPGDIISAITEVNDVQRKMEFRTSQERSDNEFFSTILRLG